MELKKALRKKNKAAGIIVATGYDAENEEVNPLTQLGSPSIVKRIVMTYQQAMLNPIIVITGFDGLSVRRHLDIYGVIFYQTANYDKADFQEDILPAIEYAASKADKIVISSVERPLFATQTVKDLVEQDALVTVPKYKEEGYGYPVVLDAQVVDRITYEDETDNWMDFIHQFENEIRLMKTTDEGTVCHVLDANRCQRIADLHDKQLLHPYVRLDIDSPTKIFDPRLKMLLLQIQDTGSVKTACERMAISVGKAWDLINSLENVLGYEVVIRGHGGNRGGRTDLTPEGADYLEKYTLLEARVKEFTDREFRKIFGVSE